MKLVKISLFVAVIMIGLLSVVFANDEIVLQVNSELNLVASGENKLEISGDTPVSWEIDDDDIVLLKSYNDFEATIVGHYYGTTNVRCKQSGNTVSEWTITVPYERADADEYVMGVGAKYLITNSNISRTESSSLSYFDPDSFLYETVFSPAELVDVQITNGGKHIIRAISSGDLIISMYKKDNNNQDTYSRTFDGHTSFEAGAIPWRIKTYQVTIVDRTTLNRKSSLELEVPEENRLEISPDNSISWKIENEDIVYFNEYEDFIATITGFSYGETVVKCMQGNRIVGAWYIVVPEEEVVLIEKEMVSGEKYIVTSNNVTLTEDDVLQWPHVSGIVSQDLIFEPEDRLEILDNDGMGNYLVKALSGGTVIVSTSYGSGGTGPIEEFDLSGHVSYSNGAAFHWVDPVMKIRIKGIETVNRKSSIELVVPEESRLELSPKKPLSWIISDENVLYLQEYHTFEAIVTGINAGTSTVTFKQGNDIVAEWIITVPEEELDLIESTMVLGKTYIVSSTSVEETDKEDFSGEYLANGHSILSFNPQSKIQEIDKDFNGRELVKPLEVGEVLVAPTSDIIIYPGPGTEFAFIENESMTVGETFGAYNYWVDPTMKITILRKGDLDKDDKVTIIDVRLLLQEYINSTSETEWEDKDLLEKDMDGNGTIDIIDVRMLLQAYINS